MRNIFKILVYSLLIIVSSSCITSKNTNLIQDIDRDYSTIPPPDEYRIIPGDQLQIVVYIYDDKETEELFRGYMPARAGTGSRDRSTAARWRTEDGTQNVTPIAVYSDGTINFPYVGRIFVQDLTMLEARKLITTRIQEISANASVNVSLFNNFFSVLGESGARRVEMKSTSMTIYQALATAGSISDYSKRDKVNIIRQTKDGSVVKTFDLRSKDIINTEFYYIQPNDVIYFPQISTKFFGATTSFIGVFGLATSFVSILVMAFKLF